MLPSYTMLGAHEVCKSLKVLETKRTMSSVIHEDEKEKIKNLIQQILEIIKEGEQEVSLISKNLEK